MEHTEPENRLIHEASPYLQQHAHNPVDWYPWGEEALTRSRREDKPIFLSVGYSTCHWCHVMEKEVIEQEAFASLFNDHFVCVKVDREERPDLDQIYMDFTRALNGQGGWPMNLFLTPELEPFYAATYIPPRAGPYGPGIVEVLTGVRDAWRDHRDEVQAMAAATLERIRSAQSQAGHDRPEIPESVPVQLQEYLTIRFDHSYPGFGTSPKFLTPQNLLFLMDQSRRDPKKADELKPDASSLLGMVTAILEAIYRGGIYDHVGGGISRYSVDRTWLVPHFEKMLYDNAFLMETAALAYQQSPLPLFRRIFDRTLAYVRDRLQRADGLFFSAEDADSEGVEGRFYVFREAEIDDILGQRANSFKQAFHVTAHGNFEGKNILNLIGTELDVLQSEESQFQPDLDRIRFHRDRRVRPHRDEKVLFAWNAMMVRALAQGSVSFGDDALLIEAEGVMGRLLQAMRPSEVLHTSLRDEIIGPRAFLDDYAYGAHAMVALYEASQKPRWLLAAIDLTEQAINRFYDPTGQAFHLAETGSADLILNPMEPYDSAIPSGNGIMAKVLEALSVYAHEPRYGRLLEDLFHRFANVIVQSPEAVPTLVEAWISARDQSLAVLTGPDQTVIRQALPSDLPRRIQLLTDASPLREAIPFLGQLPRTEDVCLYLCSNGTCSLPRSLT